MDERPVTGSCEQCGRAYSLLIPVPGSGDLEFERVAEAFGWCVECGRFVGRACCWGNGDACARCAAARRPDAEAGPFAALAAARAAVRQADGTAAAFSPVEESIATALGVGIGAASGAWEDAWLAAGALRTRIDSTRDAARSRLLALPAAELAAAMELEEDLAAAVAAHDARWDAVVDGLARAGRRVAVAAAAAGSAAKAARPVQAAKAEPPPIPVAAAVAVPVPIRPPDRVTIVVATDETPAPPVLAAAAAAPPTAIGASRRVAPPVSAPVAGVPLRPIRPSVSERRPPADTTAAAPITPVQVAPRRPRPSVDRHEGRRRRGAVAGVLLIGTFVLGGGLLARAIGQLGAESGSTAERGSDPRVVVGSIGPRSSGPGSASSLPPASPIQTGISPALLVNFDLAPVGPLDPSEPPIARAIGEPQISPFPTPFDRSLRLTGPAAAGVCVRLPADAARPLSAMTFDLYLGEAGSSGRIIIGVAALDPAPTGGLALDLATLEGLDREAWYRLVVTRLGDASRVAVRSTGGGRLLLEADLETDPASEPTSPGEACLSSSLPTAGASLFVDNLRLDR